MIILFQSIESRIVHSFEFAHEDRPSLWSQKVNSFEAGRRLHMRWHFWRIDSRQINQSRLSFDFDIAIFRSSLFATGRLHLFVGDQHFVAVDFLVFVLLRW